MLPNIVARLKNHRRSIRIEGHADWIAPSLDNMNLVLQHAADHDDAPVALGEMLLRVNCDRPLANLGFVITRMALVLLLGHVPPEFTLKLRAHPAEVTRMLGPASNINAEGCIIDWQDPADRFHARELRNTRVWHNAQGRDHSLGHTVERLAIHLARRAHGDTAR